MMIGRGKAKREQQRRTEGKAGREGKRDERGKK